MRPQRILLGIAAVVLVLSPNSGLGGVDPGPDMVAVVAAIAGSNVVWNLLALAWVDPLRDRPRAGDAQIAIDLILAFAAVVAVDVWSNPLVWILLLVPVVDGAFRYGWRGGVFVWGLVSLLYMNVVLWLSPADSVWQDVIQAGVLQIVAVLGVSISVSAVSARVSRRLEEIKAAHARSETHRHRLALIGQSARRMGAAASTPDVVAEAVATALALGLDRADLSERHQSDGGWRLAGSAGHASGIDPDLDPVLARAAASASVASVGVAHDDVVDRQALEDLGYRQMVAVVACSADGAAFALRGYSAQLDQMTASLGSALEALVAHTAIAALNARSQAELAAWADQLDHRASHDELTGLANRASILRHLASTGPSTALLFLDLDGFKEVNDTNGHEAGDHVLVVVAERLAAIATGDDFVGRLGGDEFVMVTQHRDDVELTALAERIAGDLGTPIAVGPATVTVGVSIGIAHRRSTDDGDGRGLLRRADGAMYEAKVTGRSTGTPTFAVADERATVAVQEPDGEGVSSKGHV